MSRTASGTQRRRHLPGENITLWACVRVCTHKWQMFRLSGSCMWREGPSRTCLYHLSSHNPSFISEKLLLLLKGKTKTHFVPTVPVKKQHVLILLRRAKCATLLSLPSIFLEGYYNSKKNNDWHFNSFLFQHLHFRISFFPRKFYDSGSATLPWGLHFQEDSSEATRRNSGETSPSCCHQLG